MHLLSELRKTMYVGDLGGDRIMDTSKEYIEMCRGATEIQELWEEQVGDVCYNNLFNTVVYVWAFGTNDTLMVTPKDPYNQGHLWVGPPDLTWLPRQDQLQGMVYSSGVFGLLDMMANFRRQIRNRIDFYIPESMEQLWLAFVMHEKYNKKWDGKDWVTK